MYQPGHRLVAASAARFLKRVHLELGGNSALVVMADVDLEKAVSVGAFGSFLHQGQICMTTGRHIVDASIVKEYGALLAEHADHLPVGNPATEQVALGPIIDEAQRDNIDRMVKASVEQGATLAAGGTYPREIDAGGNGYLSGCEDSDSATYGNFAS